MPTVARATPPPCPQPAERRREPRYAASVEVGIEVPGGTAGTGVTLDLSLGGVCVETPVALRAGCRVFVTLCLPAPLAPIRTDALVRWVRAAATGHHLAGLSLPPLPARDRDALRTFLAALG